MNSLPSSLLFSQSGERNCVARSLFFWHQQTRREKKQGKKFSIHCLQAGKEKGKEEGCFRKALRRREKKFLFGQKKLVASPLHFLSSAWTGRKKISNFSTSSTLPPIKESSTFSLSLSLSLQSTQHPKFFFWSEWMGHFWQGMLCLARPAGPLL